MSIQNRENKSLMPEAAWLPQPHKKTDVAVIGMACRFPGAPNYQQFWHNLVNQVDSITEIPADRWRWQTYWGDPQTTPNKTNSKWGGFIEDIDKFDPLFFNISPKEANYMDPQHRIILQTIWHAIEDAGYKASDLSGEKIGVYVGVSKNDYAEAMRDQQQEIVSFVSTGTVHSILANRVSYLLNLRGKSETIDTACSSSLVALHNAIRDIQLGECSAALVGGVNALLTPTMYISHAKSGMLSPDGRCKTFDASANGYVRSEGVGVIFIKALDQALADEDHIIGVIKGIAVNHGGRANSLTSPNVTAQAEVIEAAIQQARVTPDSISYIETHGTATPLGDPIEIRGLTKAFKQVSEEQSCGLGSVKTNIGHLESAAGMAGLIKLLMCLQNRQLPATLHLKKLNPYIKLQETPFFVVDKLIDWKPANGNPLRAGLSAFGMGGVNAHVIVEEAPNTRSSIPEPLAPHLIPLSAKNETALLEYATTLHQHLDTHSPDLRLADVAFTLQNGRLEMTHRVIFLATTIDDLKQRLKQFIQKQFHHNIWVGHVTHQSETAFKAAANDPVQMAAHWVQGTQINWHSQGYRIPLPVYPFAKRHCWFKDESKTQIKQPPMKPNRDSQKHLYTLQPTDYFIRDHHVQGQPVLPGVAYFDIVHSLAEEQYSLSVRTFNDVHWLAPLLVHDDLEATIEFKQSAFAIKTTNGSHMIGKIDIKATKPLFPLQDIRDIIERCPHSSPITKLYQQFKTFGLTYGPSFQVIQSCHYNAHEVICRLEQSNEVASSQAARLEPAILDGVFQAVVALSILGDSEYTQQYLPFQLGSVSFYEDIPAICYAHVYRAKDIKDNKNLFFDMRLYNEQGGLVAAFNQFVKRPLNPPPTLPTSPLSGMTNLHTYTSTWLTQPLTMHRHTLHSLLLFDHDEQLYTYLTNTIIDQTVILVQPGEHYQQIAAHIYTINPNQPNTYQTLLNSLQARSIQLDTLLYHWNFEATGPLPHMIQQGILPLLFLTQNIISAQTTTPIHILYTYHHHQTLESVIHAMPGGLARTLAYENPQLAITTVGIDTADLTTVASLITAEITHYIHTPLQEVIYQQKVRKVRTIIEHTPALPTLKTASLLKPNGVYLITGGAGGIGQVLARHLATHYQATIVIVGRSHTTPAIEEKLRQLQTVGGNALYFSADVAHKAALQQIITTLNEQGITLNGVIHAAGLIDDAFIIHKTADSFAKVISPKVYGTYNLDKVTRTQPLDFFLVLSSIAALMPNQGQSDYAAANSYLDHFVAYRNQQWANHNRNGRSLSINWPLWQNGGITVTDKQKAHLWDIFGLKPMSNKVAIAIFEASLQQTDNPTYHHLIVIEGDKQKIDHHLGTRPQVAHYLKSEISLDPTQIPPHYPHTSLIDITQSDTRQLHYKKTLYNDEFFMRDHVVAGKFNVPGASYIEMARQACALSNPHKFAYKLTNNYWAKQLSSSGAPLEIDIQLMPQTGYYEYEISHLEEGSKAVYALGQVYNIPDTELATIDLGTVDWQAIKERCTLVRHPQEIYAQIIAEGLHVGPTFQPMTEIYLSQKEALAHLRLPEIIANTDSDYLLHPTMLTGVLQTALLNNKPYGIDGSQFIPIGIDEILLTQKIPAVCYIYTQPHEANTNNEAIKKFEAKVLTTTGQVIAKLSGLSLRALSTSKSQKHTPIINHVAPKAHTKADISQTQVEQFLISLIADSIGLIPSEIDAAATFEAYGINSVMIVDLNHQLEKVFGTLSKTLFFEYQNFQQLAAYFHQNHWHTLEAILPQTEQHIDVPTEETAVSPQHYKPSQDDDIAIIGVAGRYPGADNINQFWTLLKAGQDAITEIPSERFDYLPYYDTNKENNLLYAKWGGFINDVDKFDPLFFNISPREAELIDPQERLFLQVVWETLEDAGYTRSRVAQQSKQVGVFVGALWQPYINIGIEETLNGNIIGPSGLLYSIPNRVSYFFNWTGPSLAIDTACSSSLTALHYACQSIKNGECDSAIVGGVNLSLTASKYLFLSQNGFLSTDGRCRSFGAGGNGYVPSEGIGAIYIKRLSDALRDGDRIMGVIKATAVNHGGKTNGYTVPNPNQQGELILAALQKSGIHPRAISYIEAHGTGTALGDPIEITGLEKAFAHYTNDKQFCAIGSVKSNIGHLEAAAGIAGLTKILLQMKHQTLVPSIHTNELNPNINWQTSPFVVQQSLSPWKTANVILDGQSHASPYAMLSSFGAGGSYAHAIIEAYPAKAAITINTETAVSRIIPLSAQSEKQLHTYASYLLETLKTAESPISLAALAYTLQTGREAMSHRVIFLVNNLADLINTLTAYTNKQAIHNGLTGQVNGPFNQLLDDKDMQDTITKWIQKGKVQQLAKFWVQGVSVDWHLLYREQKPTPVSLPTYPFLKERYWLPEAERPSAHNIVTHPNNRPVLHPLIHQNISDITALAYKATFSGNEFFFQDHQINHTKILPGVAHLELAQAAGAITGKRPVTQLSNIVWAQPISFTQPTTDITISLYPTEETVHYEISTKSAQNKVIHSQGKITYAALTPIQPLDLTAVRATLSASLDQSNYYQPLQALGLHLGHTFQSIRHIDYNQTEALAQLNLPTAVTSQADQFYLHPSLMDAVFQLTSGVSLLNNHQPGLYIPFELKELQIYAPIPPKAYAYVTYSPGYSQQTSQDIIKYDALIMDEHGQINISFKGITTRMFVKASTPAHKSLPHLHTNNFHDIPTLAPTQENTPPSHSSQGDKKQSRHNIQSALRQMLTTLLKVKKEDLFSHKTFGEYGLESITLTKFANQLNKLYQLELTPTLFFEYNTIDTLSTYLLDNHLEAIVQPETTKPTSPPANTHPQIHPFLSISQTTTTPTLHKQTRPVKKPIAIIGMDGILPGSPDLETFWQNLANEENLITEIPTDRWDWRDYYGNPRTEKNKTHAKWGGFIDDVDKFDAPFFSISPREAELMDPQQRLLLQSVWKCIEDAGYRPSQLAGTNTGVYVGVSATEYWDVSIEQGVDIEGHTATGLFHSVLANRVSFQFDWHGPSEPIDTACSSALVALHRAVRAIQAGDCHLAIVGGVNILLSPRFYISFDKAGMLADDGLCKTFDKRANGYVRGEGIGTILLKPLSQAEADGDTIYATIRATSQNHGGHANSLTAPNPKAQADLMLTAFAENNIDPTSISYIEAHGTGTALGDPLEVDGLKKAFTTMYQRWQKPLPSQPHIGLGSVKSNIGHLEPAAGIAGIFKVLLAMKHKTLPASLHIQEPNPYIDLTGSPFYLVRQTQTWQPLLDENGRSLPRRAGVNSFGFGGAYAHAILEEYTPSEKRLDRWDGRPQLIILSASNKERLSEIVDNFIHYLHHNPEATNQNLSRIAYTLQTGREALEARLALLVHDVETLTAKLVHIQNGRANIPHVFIGQGRQGKKTLQQKFSGTDLNNLSHDWLSQRAYESLAEVWVNGFNIEWQHLYTEQQPQRINLPTYPFAKKRYWVLEPVKPSTATPITSITHTNTTIPQQHHPMIHENSSHGDKHQFRTHYHGHEFFIRDHQILDKPILPGVAYLEMARAASTHQTGETVLEINHNIWVRPILLAGQTQTTTIDLTYKPDGVIDYTIGVPNPNLTQTPVCGKGQIIVGQASSLPLTKVDITTIAQRCHQTIHKEAVYAHCKAHGLNYGPSFQSIETIQYNHNELLVRLEVPDMVRAEAGAFVLHPSIMDGAVQATLWLRSEEELPDNEGSYMLFAIKGIQIVQATPIQGYAHIRFSQSSASHGPSLTYDVDIVNDQGEICITYRDMTVRRVAANNNHQTNTNKARKTQTVVYATPQWQEKVVESNHSGTHSSAETILFIGSVPQQTAVALQNNIHFSQIHQLPPVDDVFMADTAITNFDTVFTTIKQIIQQRPQVIHKLLVLIPDDIHTLVQAPLIGLFKTAQLENNKVQGKLITVAGLSQLRLEQLTHILHNESHDPQNDVEVRYTRHGKREVKQLVEAPLPTSTNTLLKPRGVYWITGGLGSLGLIFAQYLSQTHRATVILSGRSPLTKTTQNRLNQMNHIAYIQADVNNETSVQQAVNQIKATYGVLNGIIHSAGVLRDAFILQKDTSDIAPVLNPKIRGTLLLDKVTQRERLDFLALFSSVTAVLGNIGQADYAGANAFLDAFAHYRNQLAHQEQRFGKTLSLNWPYWENGGMSMDAATKELLKNRLGLEGLHTDTGLNAFAHALHAPFAQLAILTGEPSIIKNKLLNIPATPNESNHLTQAPTPTADHADLTAQVQSWVQTIMADALKMPAAEIDQETNFERFGVDSLIQQSIIGQLEAVVGDISRTLLFEYPNLEELVNYLVAEHNIPLQNHFSPPDKQSQTAGLTPSKQTHTHEQQSTPATTITQSLNPKPIKDYQQEDIAIIGLSGRYPMADDLQTFWQNLQAGKNCLTPVPNGRFHNTLTAKHTNGHNKLDDQRYSGFLAEIDHFDNHLFPTPDQHRARMSPEVKLLLETAWQLFEDAGYPQTKLHQMQTEKALGIGVYIGAMYNQHMYRKDSIAEAALYSNLSDWDLANRISHFFDLNGPSLAVNTACSSSMTAIHLACTSLKNKECYLAIAGGVNLILDSSRYRALDSTNFLGQGNQSKSFGEGDGFIPGEGVGLVLLKPLSAAKQDGDKIYGVIKSSFVNHGGGRQTYTAPDPKNQENLILQALKRAGIHPETISYVESAANGSALGDPLELVALSKAFAHYTNQRQFCAIGSVKSNIGHLEASSGISQLTKVLLQLKHQTLVPSINAHPLNPNIHFQNTPFYLQNQVSPWSVDAPLNGNKATPRRAMINSFGAGGSYANLIVDEYIPKPTAMSSHYTFDAHQEHIFLFSAQTNWSLHTYLQRFKTFITTQTNLSLTDVALTLQLNRNHLDKRAAIVASSLPELMDKLTAVSQPTDTSYSHRVYTSPVSSTAANLNQAIVNRDLDTLAQAWVSGQTIDWATLHDNPTYQMVNLPGYAFDHQDPSTHLSGTSNTHNTMPQQDHLYQTVLEGHQPLTQTITNLADKIQAYLHTKLTNAIGNATTSIDTNKNLMDLGLDSISLTTLTTQLEQEAGIKLHPTIFFEYPNLHELTQFFAQAHAHAFQKLLSNHSIPNGNKLAQPSQAPAPTPATANTGKATQTPISLPLPLQTHTIKQPEKQYESHVATDDIAIIGMHGLFAQSPTLDHFWQNLLEGRDLITEIPPDRFDYQTWYNPDPAAHDAIYCKWGSFIEDVDKFDASFFGISPHEADWMDPQLRLLLQSIYATSEDAGYAAKMRGTNTGVFVGACFQDYGNKVRDLGYPMDPYFGTGNSPAVLANRASFAFDFTGPSIPFDTACSSSLFALHAATTAIQKGECKAAFVSGVNLILHPFRHRYFCKIGALSPTGRCHTFEAAADGYVPGEAIATILLKPLHQAQKDGDRIHAVIKGSAALHGGYTPSLTAPSVQGEANVILKAWADANLDPTTLTYIEAHGTGTPLGDPIEINALKKAFAHYTNKVDFCAVGSAKAHIGHTEGAAGLSSIIKVILQMKQGQIPAMPQFNKQNPYIQLDNSPLYINRTPVKWERQGGPRRAGINSFGFSGSYAHVVLEEYISPSSPDKKATYIEENHPIIVPLSAKSEQGVHQIAKNLLAHLSNKTTLHRQDIAYTLQMGREPMAYRAAFITHDLVDLKEQLAAFNAGNESDQILSGQIRKEDRILFEADQELTTLTQAWVAHRKMKKIAALWVRGGDVDWQLLYPHSRPQLISLPTYPFAQKRYWVTEKYKGETSIPQQISEATIPHPPATTTKEAVHTNGTSISTAVSPHQPTITQATPKTTTTLQDVISYLTKRVQDVTGLSQSQLDIHQEVQNYGFDSIIITKLASDLEAIIGKKDTAIFFSANTIHRIAANIFNKYQDHLTTIPTPSHSPTPEVQPIPTVTPTPSTSHATTEKESTPVTNSDVAIIGLAGRYPQADNLFAFFENLKQGIDAIEEIPKARWDYLPYLSDAYENGKIRAKWGGFITQVNNFDYENFGMSYREALITHPEERLLLQQTWHCLESAGYNPLTWSQGQSNHIGVYIGASFHEYPHLVADSNQQNDTYIPFSAQTFSYANRLSYFYNLTGPSVTLDTACSSSLYALFEAYNHIVSGVCDAALAGGVNLNLHPSKFIWLSELNFLAVDGHCRAFTEGGNGYVPGEGIGMVMLKRLDRALEDNDNILAVIKSVSAGNDGRTNGFTVPNPQAQSNIIKRAIQNAGIHPETITAIECHGTGTALGDPIEIAALTDTFRHYTPKAQYCAVSSVKSNIGHLEAAAGIAQITKAILQLKNKLLFPNVMHGPQLNPNIHFAHTPFYVQQDLAAWNHTTPHTPRRMGVSSFGAGGTNVHLILEEYLPQPTPKDIVTANSYHLLPFSADSQEQLLQIIQDTYHFLTNAQLNIFNSPLTIANIAGTLQHGRAMKKHRLAIICAGQLPLLLENMAQIINTFSSPTGSVNKNHIIMGVAQKEAPHLPADGTPHQDKQALINIAQQWVHGATINWQQISPAYHPVILPGYPFQNKQIDLHQYHTTEALLTADKITPPTAANPIIAIKQNIIQALRKGVGPLADTFNEESDFADYGIDSIMSTRVLAELAPHYGKLGNFVLLEYSTVNKLANYLLTLPTTQTTPSPTSPLPPTDDSETIGEIQNLSFGDENEALIPFQDFITAYQKQGGQHHLERLDVLIRDNKLIEVIACGQGETVVLLPPFNSSAIIWIQQLLHLSQHYRVLVIHYPGLGNSDWLDDLKNFGDLATAVIDTLSQLKARQHIADKAVTLVGWSFGGFLAQTIAVTYPQHIKKLILVSTTAISWSSDEYQISSEEFSLKSAQEFRANYHQLPDFIKNMPTIQAWHHENQIEKFVLGTQEKRVINRYFLMIARYQHLETAQQINCPTYLISGAEDELMPAKFARRLHQNIQDSHYYEVEGGQHFLSLFKKEIVNQKLHDWLK